MFGRRREQIAIDAVLDATRDGRSGVLVIHGDAGMGKTMLLDYAVASAGPVQVARISGIEAETGYGFAALQRLFIPFMEGFDRLPERQREALGSAFGLTEGPPADRFLIGLAALTLLAEAAGQQPLVCVVDDAQWLDRESLDALAFVGRRLYADQIALLFAVRTSPLIRVPLDGLPALEIGGLADDAAIALLESLSAGPVDAAVTRRIVAEAEGCPLAVTELAASLSSEQLIGAGFLPEQLPISGRLESHFLAQVSQLPSDTQLLMLVAAAEATGDPIVLWRAAHLLGVTPAAAEPAEASHLIALQTRVEFRHPLIRSAVYGGANPASRRRVHAALAEATDAETDPDGRAWHLAAASMGPDEEVAAELERGAVRARRRGRYAADAALLTRSAELTPDVEERARRLLTAAQLHQVAGAPHHAADLLAQAKPELRGPLQLAQARRLDAALRSYAMPGEIPAVLLEAARALERLDVRLARDTYAETLEAALVSCQLTRHTTLDEIGHAALDAPAADDPEPTIADLMIDGWATRLAVGYAEAVPHFRRIIATLRADDSRASGYARWGALGANAGTETWDADGYRAMLLRLERNERERGALDSLRITLGGLGHSEMWSGRFAAAEARHSEATDIAVAAGADALIWEMLKVELFAWQGRDTETRSIATALTTTVAAAAGAGVAVNLALVALTILELGHGDYDAAIAAGWQLFESDAPPQATQVLPDLVEASVRAGDLHRAGAAFERLEQRATASATPWALGLLARATALLAPEAEAEAHYEESVARLGETWVVTDLARSHLVYGEWLRRQNRRIESREQLRTAHEMFVSMGAEGFAARARTELAATGERVRARNVEATNELTPQEAQIAGLAATGMTRGEIATKLFLSASTIDYHLRKVYRKLGVTSRRELRRALPESVALPPELAG